VLQGLEALAKCFGYTTNKLGFKVITGAGIIQGDGLNMDKIADICEAVYKAKFSAQCVCYGMGGGLVQEQTRDTQGVAIKLCEDELDDGTVHAKQKRPATDPKKNSFPGDMSVVHGPDGLPYLLPRECLGDWTDALEVIYDKRPIGYKFETFQGMINRKEAEWNRFPRNHNYLTQAMLDKIGKTQDAIARQLAAMNS
jgi:nicotinamide phosphoribosyltransferase